MARMVACLIHLNCSINKNSGAGRRAIAYYEKDNLCYMDIE